MNIVEAAKLARDGVEVRRRRWQHDLKLYECSGAIIQGYSRRQVGHSYWRPSQVDVLSDDWEVV